MTEVEKFCVRIEKAIQEEGLVGRNDIRFDEGGTPMDVLRQVMLLSTSDKFISTFGAHNVPKDLEQVAKSLNKSDLR